jgi:hypothetical protein
MSLSPFCNPAKLEQCAELIVFLRAALNALTPFEWRLSDVG